MKNNTYELYRQEWDKIYYSRREIGYQEEVIQWADISTFQILDSWFNVFAKDKNYIYFGGDIFAWADVESFETLGGEYAKDKNNINFIVQII